MFGADGRNGLRSLRSPRPNHEVKLGPCRALRARFDGVLRMDQLIAG